MGSVVSSLIRYSLMYAALRYHKHIIAKVHRHGVEIVYVCVDNRSTSVSYTKTLYLRPFRSDKLFSIYSLYSDSHRNPTRDAQQRVYHNHTTGER